MLLDKTVLQTVSLLYLESPHNYIRFSTEKECDANVTWLNLHKNTPEKIIGKTIISINSHLSKLVLYMFLHVVG